MNIQKFISDHVDKITQSQNFALEDWLINLGLTEKDITRYRLIVKDKSDGAKIIKIYVIVPIKLTDSQIEEIMKRPLEEVSKQYPVLTHTCNVLIK